MSDPGAQLPNPPPSERTPPSAETVPSEARTLPPPGHLACPKCGYPVLPAAPLCPQCGVGLRNGRRAPKQLTGLRTILAGVALCGVSTMGMCVLCMAGMSAGSSGFRLPVWVGPIALLLFLAGIALMVVGFVSSLVQALRK